MFLETTIKLGNYENMYVEKDLVTCVRKWKMKN